jgi:nitrous oxide reductase accessory protein NosL
MAQAFAALALLCLASPAIAQTREDVSRAPSCKYCGMDREKFGHSRMLLEYDDGSVIGTCSLHCVAVDLAVTLDRSPTAIKVGDLDTKELVDAEKAVWVVGGDRPGVMTKRAKWAFRDRAAAEAFVKQHGGTIATFDEAMRAAYADMYEDGKMIREKRRIMRTKASTPAAAPAPPAGHQH